MDCRVAALLAMTNFISAPRNDKLAAILAMIVIASRRRSNPYYTLTYILLDKILFEFHQFFCK